ncbi:MAG TPA: HAMP domain-containing sensor histidine kinase [Polyangiaceae bacterium]
MPEPRPRELRLFAYVVSGAFLGAVYVALDVASEARLEEGTLHGPLAELHVLDHILPVLIGGLLGISAHYLRLRRRLFEAEQAAARSEALRSRLLKVERDQAVWVLAASVLHELNNPLHALGLLLDELSGDDIDEARREELLLRARAQADRALSHLRTLSGMRSDGEPEFQRIALDEIARSVASDAAVLVAERGVTVRVECAAPPIEAHADPAYVRTILESLLDNSLQSFDSNAGDPPTAVAAGAITLTLSATGGRALVRVEDDGIPLPPGARAELFEPFRTTKTHGLGLGLPIARALARAMRGDLSLDETAEKAFLLDLPRFGGSS